MSALDLKLTGPDQRELTLEWVASSSNDMIADAALTLVLGIDQSRASVKSTSRFHSSISSPLFARFSLQASSDLTLLLRLFSSDLQTPPSLSHPPLPFLLIIPLSLPSYRSNTPPSLPDHPLRSGRARVAPNRRLSVRCAKGRGGGGG